MTTARAPWAARYLLLHEHKFFVSVQKITETRADQDMDGKGTALLYAGEQEGIRSCTADNQVTAQFKAGGAACLRRASGFDRIHAGL